MENKPPYVNCQIPESYLDQSLLNLKAYIVSKSESGFRTRFSFLRKYLSLQKFPTSNGKPDDRKRCSRSRSNAAHPVGNPDSPVLSGTNFFRPKRFDELTRIDHNRATCCLLYT